MPVWSMVNTCQTGLAPNPGSANAPMRRSGMVFAWVRPAALTTVPMRVATPSDSSWAMAAAASGLAVRGVTEAIVRCRARARVLQCDLAALADVEGAQHSAHPQPHRT